MVSIIHIKNPFDPYKDLDRCERSGGISIKAYLLEKYGEDWAEFTMPTLCILNGKPMLRGTWDGTILIDGDILSFVTLAGEAITLVGWIIIALVAVAAVGAYMYMQSLEIPTVPGQNTTAADNVYSLSGQKNRVRLGEPIEVTYGKMRLWPSYGALVYICYSGNEQFNYSLYCLGQGEFDIEKIQIEDTLIGNFEGVQYEIIPPGGDVTLFPDNVVTSVEIANIELFGPNEAEYDDWVGPFTLNPTQTRTNHIEIDLVMPQGLYYNTSGALGDATVAANFEIRSIDDYGNPLGSWISLASISITRATNTPQRLTYKYEVPSNRYEIRGKRTNNTLDTTTYISKLVWESARAFLPSTKDYGNVTMLAVVIRASNNINNSSQSRVNVIATRKLPIWNPTGEGSWSAPTATRSIVWAFCDLFRSYYGAGLADMYLDLDSLLALDAEFELRNEHFDFTFDTPITIWEAAKAIARIGRAIPIPFGSRIGMIRDTAKTLTSAVFSPDNIIKDSFQLEYRHYQPDETDHIIMVYKDPVSYLEEEVICSLEGSPLNNPERIEFGGCINRNHAYHEGMYILLSKLKVTDSVTFKTGLEGHLPTYGDRIEILHDVPRIGLSSGFVLAIDNTVLTLSQEAIFFDPAQSYSILLRKRDGSASGPHVVTAGADSLHVILRNEIDPDDFIFDSYSEPPIFLFGIVDKVSMVCKVVSVTPGDSDTVEVSCVNYTDDIFDYDLIDAPVDPNAVVPPSATGVIVVTGLAVSLNPLNFNVVTVSWSPAVGAVSYIIEQSENGVDWARISELTGTQYVLSVIAGMLYVRVAGVGAAIGPWAEWNGIVGPDAIGNPNTPTGSGWTFSGLSAHITWDEMPDAKAYYIRVLADGGAVVARTATVSRGHDFYYHYEDALYDCDKFSTNAPQRNIKFEVRTVYHFSGASDPLTINVANSLPVAPTNLRFNKLSPTLYDYDLYWDHTIPQDHRSYKVYVSTTDGFTPSSGNLRETITDMTKSLRINTGGAPTYFRVAALDVWGLEEAMSAQKTIP